MNTAGDPRDRDTMTAASIAPAAAAGTKRTSRLRSRAWRIAAIYAVIAMLWIYFSDRAMAVLIQDPAELVHWSVYKGIAFVGLTSVLLWLMMLRTFGAIESGYVRLSEQKKTIERFNRLYAALSEIDQAIVWSTNRDELFRKTCQAFCEQGGFHLAWIGHEDSSGQVLVPVASWGDVDNDVGKMVSEAGGVPMGFGPSGRAFREGRPCFGSQVARQPAVEAKLPKAARRGARSVGAFPIQQQGKVCGVLTVQAGEDNFFAEREIALLDKVALNLSFALDNFLREEERLRVAALANKEQMFSQAMLESMPGIVYFYNEAGRFLRWNRNFENVSGYSGEDILNMHPLHFFSEADQALLAERISQVFETGEASIEARFVARNGTTTPYYLTGKRIMFDGMPCLVGVGMDISKRKIAEQALRELNETLEHRIAERTAQLQETAVRAEAADRLKSAFLATMSHELRTPLNSIIGFTSIVLQGLPGPLNAEQAKQLGMVRNSARHLLELINDVLDLSKIEAGQLEVRQAPFDLSTSIQGVTDSIRPLIEKKGLALVLDPLPDMPAMVGDRRRIEQILLNLLSNAIKFTDCGSVRLTVERVDDFRVTPAATPASAVRLTIADTGVGIKQEELAYLFQPFRQLDNGLTRQHEGTGLGLAICRRLAKLMGGQVTARSEWSIGSEFTVTLPFQPDAKA